MTSAEILTFEMSIKFELLYYTKSRILHEIVSFHETVPIVKNFGVLRTFL